MSHYPTAGSSSTSGEVRPTTSRRSHWKRHAISAGSAASSISRAVADIRAGSPNGAARGAQLLTPRGNTNTQIRCCLRDPDGHLIEVGQTTDKEGDWSPARWPSSTSAEKLNEEGFMTTAMIGTGGIGSVIARQLASGGETLRLSSADSEWAPTLATGIGRTAVVAVDNRDALRNADAVVLALRFAVLKGSSTRSPIR